MTRPQWIRLVIVGIFVAFSIGRVAPDVIRVAQPLGYFRYATDFNAVVTSVEDDSLKGHAGRGDRVELGDRIRIDRVRPFDRKPGIAGVAFTRANFDRYLPIERAGREQILHLRALQEPLETRVSVLLRVIIFALSVAVGSILFLVKPGIGTFAFFLFCLGGDYPTTFTDAFLDVPFRTWSIWAGDTLRGAARASLLLFGVSQAVQHPLTRRVLAIAIGIAGIAFGTVHAYAHWAVTFAALPGERYEHFFLDTSLALGGLTAIAFAAAFLRRSGVERQRIGYIIAAFAIAGIARLASDRLFPGHISVLFNQVLLTLSVIPIVVVWFAVVRLRFFEIDFVVNRAMVFMALLAAIAGSIYALEEVVSYIFYLDLNVAYLLYGVIVILMGAFTGKIQAVLSRLIDRFIFRDRMTQREALEFISGYILDAETVEDVYRALLQDASHALKLSFSGILTRCADSSFEVTADYQWPADLERRLAPNDALIAVVTRSRSVLSLGYHETNSIRQALKNERLTFAAPIFTERTVSAVVVYGHNISGLDLDPEERQLLTRIVAHASIALNSIELARYRALERGAAPALEGA